MKIQKLTIQNIASIEEATIDFAHGPLAEESIFLICGETGAGKSTLLDAICLALYKDTPRMKRTNRESYQDSGITTKDHVQTNDCRQLVRRNAKEASVELEFMDADDTLFTARWSVERARTGNLKKAEWQLYNHRTDESLHKDADIEAEIHRIIGLDFEQFCRTTLLAQGEFTRFLQSNAHEKADILERLTNTDIYSQIGTRIYECWKTHKAAYEMQKVKLENIQRLTDEDKTALSETLTRIQAEIQQIQLQQEKGEKQIQWLTTEQTLSEKIITAHQAYDTVQAALQSDGFKEGEKLLQDWDCSTDARGFIREGLRLQQQFAQEEKEAESLINKLRKLSPQPSVETTQILPLLQKEAQTLQTRCQEIEKRIQQQQTEIARQERHFKEMHLEEKENRKEQLLKEIGRLQEVQNQLFLWEEKKKSQQEAQEEVQALQQQLQVLTQQGDTQQKEWQQAIQNRQWQEALVKKLKEATENWAKEARRKLKEGDSCPVCGQLIDRVLSDETFQSQLEGPEQELIRLQKSEEGIRNQYNQTQAEAKQSQLRLQTVIRKQEDIQKACEKLLQQVTVYGQQLQLTALTPEAIHQRTTAQKEEMESLNQQLKAGKELQTALSDAQKQWQQFQQQGNQVREKQHACQLNIQSVQTLLEQQAHVKARQENLRKEEQTIQEQLQAFLNTHLEISAERLRKLAAYPDEKVQNMRQRMQQTREDLIKKETTLQDLQKEKESHLLNRPALEPKETLAMLTQRKEQQLTHQNRLREERGQIQEKLKQDQEATVRQATEIKRQEEYYQTYLKWTRLKELFGSADGKTFRAIAQSFILKELLQNANFYLKHFTDRYRLEGQGITLTILLRDFYEGGVTRPVSTLSGGESFLVSLALALGLSSLNKQQSSIDTLFIDEGFGTLSSDYLQTVMDTLEKLHQLGGKKVGIISHVEGLRERIRTQIQVRRIDNSRSEVIVK